MITKYFKILFWTEMRKSNAKLNALAYQVRIHKFHTKTGDHVLAINKDNIIYDYKAFNHNFSKCQNNGQFINRLSKGDMLSER